MFGWKENILDKMHIVSGAIASSRPTTTSNSNNVQQAVVAVFLVDGDTHFRLLGDINMKLECNPASSSMIRPHFGVVVVEVVVVVVSQF